MSSDSPLLSTDLRDLNLFRRGKVRDIYDLGDKLLFIATDRISAFDVIMKKGIPGKGEMLNKLSAFWFGYLKDIVPNHLITAEFEEFPEELKSFPGIAGRSMLVRKVDRIDIECIVRGYITGSAWQEYQTLDTVQGMKLLHGNYIPADLVESAKFSSPIFTPSLKADDGHDENIPLDKFYDLIGKERGNEIIEISIQLYERAGDYAQKKGLILADTKFEFGIENGELVLIDEVLTPDSSRFWGVDKYVPGKPQESFDKQYLRDYLKSVGWKGQPPPPDLPDDVVKNTAAKYREALNILIK